MKNTRGTGSGGGIFCGSLQCRVVWADFVGGFWWEREEMIRLLEAGGGE